MSAFKADFTIGGPIISDISIGVIQDLWKAGLVTLVDHLCSSLTIISQPVQFRRQRMRMRRRFRTGEHCDRTHSWSSKAFWVKSEDQELLSGALSNYSRKCFKDLRGLQSVAIDNIVNNIVMRKENLRKIYFRKSINIFFLSEFSLSFLLTTRF